MHAERFDDLALIDELNALAAMQKKIITKYDIESNCFFEEVDSIVEERPVALVYNGIAYAVMMMLPLELEYFALGFSLSEGIINHPKQIRDIEIKHTKLGILLEIEISSQMQMALKAKKKAMVGRTGCGLCGSAFLQQVFLELPSLPNSQTFAPEYLSKTLEQLAKHQHIGRQTAGTHIMVWVDNTGNIIQSFEDVGRHIALDKLLGYCLTNNIQQGALILSSRASYEMVQKAARAGVEIIFAFSAVTELAIQIAKQANVTLCGFAKNNKISVYTGIQRIKNRHSQRN